MRIDIEAIGEKKRNYKKIILVIAIIIASIACIYIGLILPQLVNMGQKNEKGSEGEISPNSAGVRLDNDMFFGTQEKPSREQEQPKKLPVMTIEGIARIKDIYNATYKRVYLTFDDGPSKTVTPQILSI